MGAAQALVSLARGDWRLAGTFQTHLRALCPVGCSQARAPLSLQRCAVVHALTHRVLPLARRGSGSSRR